MSTLPSPLKSTMGMIGAATSHNSKTTRAVGVRSKAFARRRKHPLRLHPVLLTSGPRLTGGPHGSLGVLRVVIHRSMSPPPGVGGENQGPPVG